MPALNPSSSSSSSSSSFSSSSSSSSGSSAGGGAGGELSPHVVHIPVCKKPGLVFRSHNLFFFFLHGRVCEEKALTHNGRYAFKVREASSKRGAIFIDTAQVREKYRCLQFMYDSRAGDYFLRNRKKPNFSRRTSDGFSKASSTWGVSGEQALEPGFDLLYFADIDGTVVPKRPEEEEVRLWRLAAHA